MRVVILPLAHPDRNLPDWFAGLRGTPNHHVECDLTITVPTQSGRESTDGPHERLANHPPSRFGRYRFVKPPAKHWGPPAD